MSLFNKEPEKKPSRSQRRLRKFSRFTRRLFLLRLPP